MEKVKYVVVKPSLHASLKAEAARGKISLQEYVANILNQRDRKAALCPR